MSGRGGGWGTLRLVRGRCLFVVVAVLQGACAAAPGAHVSQVAAAPASAPAPAPAPARAPAPASAPAPARAQPPRAVVEALAAASRAIEAGDGAGGDEQLAIASAAAGDDAHSGYLVARVRAARFVYAGDFDRAAGALLAVIPALVAHPELPDEFWSHNTMMMIREAQGDPASALAENDQATLCAARGTWDPKERDTLAFQKDRWHCAYLTRMLAESRAGAAKQALVEYARAALDDYRGRGFPESVAVLEAYFAALDGRRGDALAAARRVDPAQDDDVEDLYLVVVGLEAGGDPAGAEAVRRVMRGPGGAGIARAIMLRWLDLDAKERGFTPRHATAR